MTKPSGLGLQAGDGTPVVVSCGRPDVSRGALHANASALAERLTAGRLSRVMVSSDDPVNILTALEASAYTSADLWIAHTSLSSTLRNEILQRFGISLWIDDDGEHLTDHVAPWPGNKKVHMMTSGTTGRPKIAAHTLESLLGRVVRQSSQAVNRDGRWLLTYQPTGFAGLQVMLTAVLSGGTIVVPRDRTPAGFLAAALSFQVTQISATPTFWRSFLMVVSPDTLALKQITLGGEGVDQATLTRVQQAFPEARITHVYASTEAGVVFAVHDGLEGFPVSWLNQRNQGIEVRLHDGFLHVRNPNAMQGYASENEQPLHDDGWLATADRCEVSGDRVRIIGRQDSTINVAGSKVYPLAIETFLLSLPGIVEAKVYGVPNPISGYLVGADIVLASEEDRDTARVRIMKACRDGLAGYQIPRAMKFVDAIEVRESGKKG